MRIFPNEFDYKLENEKPLISRNDEDYNKKILKMNFLKWDTRVMAQQITLILGKSNCLKKSPIKPIF